MQCFAEERLRGCDAAVTQLLDEKNRATLQQLGNGAGGSETVDAGTGRYLLAIPAMPEIAPVPVSTRRVRVTRSQLYCRDAAIAIACEAAVRTGQSIMSDVFYVRPVDPPISPEVVHGMAQYAGGCFAMHHVDWKHSFLSEDGGRMLCWYHAADAESARLALRELGSNMNAVWAGTVTGEGTNSLPISRATLLAEVQFDDPIAAQDLALRVSVLEQQAITLVRGILSIRGTRWLGLLDAPDEQAARVALERANLAAATVWACTPITPGRQR
jgi:Nickel responsive protein SCO4226-like